jgi:tetratricopeptide (TPR) repeat protein
MRNWWFLCGLALLLGLPSPQVPAQSNPAPDDPDALTAEREALFDQLWMNADAAHDREDYRSAEQQYRTILAEFPDSQRTCLRIARTIEQQGRHQESLAIYRQAIEMARDSSWAATGLFYRARAARDSGNPEEARQDIVRLRMQHPDSSYVAQAALLEAQIAGRGVAEAQANLDRELAAAEMCDAAMALSANGDDDDAMAALQRVIETQPGTAVNLRAQSALGHILTRNQRHEEALECFTRLHEQLLECAPDSHAAVQAQTRIAALNHVLENRDDAFDQYMDLANEHGDTEAGESAMLQASGVLFEQYQRMAMEGLPVSGEAWEELRSLMIETHDGTHLDASDTVRADLMFVESFTWHLDWEGCLASAALFLQTYTGEEFPLEVSTARYFAGVSAQNLGRWEEALDHFNWVIEHNADATELWPGMDHLARTHMGRWYCLWQGGHDTETVADAAWETLARFPNSSVSLYIRHAAATNEPWTEGIEPPTIEEIIALQPEHSRQSIDDFR